MTIMIHRDCNAVGHICWIESSPICKERLYIEKVKNHIKIRQNIKKNSNEKERENISWRIALIMGKKNL
ncbi:MAG: hypothetical protein KID00_10965 [Clostridium argentinense]|nr:hypothetical protein [Clostridium argentinense]